MLKTTHFSLASGRHREYLCFILMPSLTFVPIYALVQDSTPNLFMKTFLLLFCRPEDDIRHWSKFSSFTPLLVIDYLTWCCQS